MNIGTTFTISDIEPAGTKNTNRTANFSFPYTISPSVDATYNLSKTNNLSKTKGKSGTTNSTLNNTLGLTFKLKKLPNFGANLNFSLANSKDGSTSTANVTMFYSNEVFNKVDQKLNLTCSETKQKGKRTPNCVFTTSLNYQY